MPRIKRWHPISHDFNHDPEVRELRKQLGDWIALAWQECLSIGDRNEGIVPGTLDQIAERIAGVSLRIYRGSSAKPARMLLEYAAKLQWILVESDHIQIVNHWKYHRTQEHKPVPSGPDPTRPDLNKNKNKKAPSALFVLPDWVPKDAWEGFVEMRKKMHKPLTERAKELAVHELEKLQSQNNDPRSVLDQSTQKSWLGLFEVKTPTDNGPAKTLAQIEADYLARKGTTH